jgi:hypothetical protein
MFGMGLPNLILIGCMKCGTTSTHKYLRKEGAGRVISGHGSEGSKHQTEAHFFDKRYDTSLSLSDLRRRYANDHFPSAATCPGCVIRFEKTPGYISNVQVPYRMRELYGGGMVQQLRLMVHLREPVARLVSAYFMYAAHQTDIDGTMILADVAAGAAVVERCYASSGMEVDPTRCPDAQERERALREYNRCAEPDSDMTKATKSGRTLAMSIYADQLANYLCAGIPAGNIMVVPFSLLTRELANRTYLNRIEGFMSGARPPGQAAAPAIRAHAKAKSQGSGDKHLAHYTPNDFELDERLRMRLEALYEPHNRRLDHLLRTAGFYVAGGDLGEGGRFAF